MDADLNDLKDHEVNLLITKSQESQKKFQKSLLIKVFFARESL